MSEPRSEYGPLVGRGWEVRFEHEWVRDGWRMHIWRWLPDNRIEVVTGELLMTTYDAHEQVEQSGIHLPADAYRSIVKAIDPPAHRAEVRRLEEALAVERQRVDAVLAAAHSGSHLSYGTAARARHTSAGQVAPMGEPRSEHVPTTTRVLVGLDYETEHPWVWVVDDPDRDAEGYSTQFAVDVPTALIEEWKAVNERQDEILGAIHTAAKFDREHTRIGDAPCGSYAGEPLHLPRGVIYDDCDACGWRHEEHDHG